MIPHSRLTLLRSLRRRKAREQEGLYLLEGRLLVEEALRSGAPVEEVLHTAGFAGEPEGRAVLDLARERGAAVESVPRRDLDRVADTRTPQGVVAVVRLEPATAGALDAGGLFLALDAVADPGNVGTLVRAADAFAARAVVAGPGSAGFENPKVLRAAMGSTFHLPLLAVADLAEFLSRRREEGAEVVAATLGGTDARGLPPGPRRRFLVLGNEARGVSAEVLALADREVTVACPGRAESLNVALAGGILLALLTGGRP